MRLGFVPALTVWCDAHFTDVPWTLHGRLGALRAHFCQAQALKRQEASVVMLIGFLRGGGRRGPSVQAAFMQKAL